MSVSSLDALVDGQKLHLEGEADLRNTDSPSGFGVLSSDALAYKGYKAEKLRVPFDVSKDVVQLHDVSAQYGGGTITANGTYDLKEQVLTADAQLQQVTQNYPANSRSRYISTASWLFWPSWCRISLRCMPLPIQWISAGAA